MAGEFVASIEPVMKETNAERLRISYRALLVHFIDYLKAAKREKEFKLFCLDYIPTKYWDGDIEDWIMKLEQSHLLTMDRVEILHRFLECFDDSANDKMLHRIRQFQYQLRPFVTSRDRALSNGRLTLITYHISEMIIDQ